jgi:hypothetical protein
VHSIGQRSANIATRSDAHHLMQHVEVPSNSADRADCGGSLGIPLPVDFVGMSSQDDVDVVKKPQRDQQERVVAIYDARMHK